MSAVSEVVYGMQFLFSESLLIRPPVGEEWVIHNLYWEDACSVFMINAITGQTAEVDSANTAGCRINLNINVTHDHYIDLLSLGMGAYAYDGRRTK